MIRCGMYLRLSREDGEGESDSIQNQRLLIQQYVKQQPDMTVIGEWVDDGWSGSRFDRPGFQKMMEAVSNGQMDCILVKDLSRLGREYIQTGQYLQEIFPKLGVRFIAIMDHYDSWKTEFMEQSLLMPVLNLMNDAYCRDISQKVRWQQQTKRQLGEYIGAFAVYGYQKDQSNPHLLVIDEEVEEVIRCIYWLRLSGMAAENIAKRLNGRRIPCPREYKRQQGSRFCSGFDQEQVQSEWSPLAVRRILHNEMYTGKMIQGKDKKISYKLKQRRKLSKEEWICVDHKVPVLIPAWLFQRLERWEKQRIHCRRGEVFCPLGAGVVSGLEQKGIVPNDLLQYLYQKYLHEKNLPERWMCQLFFSLFFQKIEIIPEEKRILLHTIWREE